jgi:hypothetical protein
VEPATPPPLAKKIEQRSMWELLEHEMVVKARSLEVDDAIRMARKLMLTQSSHSLDILRETVLSPRDDQFTDLVQKRLDEEQSVPRLKKINFKQAQLDIFE